MKANVITENDIVQSLKDIGIVKNDSVIVHSSYRAMGKVEEGPETVLRALLRAVGTDGNLMLPVFNYTKSVPEPYFDPEKKSARTGIINELGRHRPDAVRSLHPAHSVAVIGPKAKFLTNNHQTSFGIDSPIDRLAKIGGKILLIGVGHVSNSTIHIAESYAETPKAAVLDELPFFKVKLPDGEIIEHQLDVSPSCSSAFGAAELALREKGLITDGKIENCKFQLMKGQETIVTIWELLKERPDIFLCKWSKCACCTKTRNNMIKQGIINNGRNVL